MSKIIIRCITFLVAIVLSVAAVSVWSQNSTSTQTRLLRFADIHHDKVSFVYSGDIYIASISGCLLYTSPSPRDKRQSRMPSSA